MHSKVPCKKSSAFSMVSSNLCYIMLKYVNREENGLSFSAYVLILAQIKAYITSICFNKDPTTHCEKRKN